MSLSFDKTNQIITVDAPDTSITIQDLIDQIREWEDELGNMEVYKVADASGKEELGGGVRVGITLTLIDWKIKFEDRAGPDWTLCRIDGGNLVRYDTGTMTYTSPIEPAAYVTVSLTSSSSATLQELSNIQHSSFNGGVTIDVVTGTSGVDYPLGTSMSPVNNLTSAKAIASSRGFENLFIIGNFTIASGDNIDGYRLEGQNPRKSTIQINAGASTSGCEFSDATVNGVLDGNSWITHSYVTNLTYVEGQISESVLIGNIVLAGNTPTRILRCWDGTAADEQPTIDLGGAGRSLVVGNYTGEIKIVNKTGSDSVAIDLLAGHVFIDSTVTNGLILVRGVGLLDDESTGSAVINQDALISQELISSAVWDANIETHLADGTMGDTISRIDKTVGKIWWVSASGSDSNSGRLPASAFATIQHAFNVSQPGDHVIVGAGNYIESDVRLDTNGIFVTFKPGTALIGTNPANPTLGVYGESCQFDSVQLVACSGQTGLYVNGYGHYFNFTSIYGGAISVHLSSGVGSSVTTLFRDTALSDFTNTGIYNDSAYTIFDKASIIGGNITSATGCYTSPSGYCSLYHDINCAKIKYGFVVESGTQCSTFVDCSCNEEHDEITARVDLGTHTSWIRFNNEVASLAWDELQSAHTESGTMGEALAAAGAGASPAAIADAVWDEAISGHVADGTAGAMLNLIHNVEGGRWKIDTTLNQMIFYAADNTTEVARFNLYDSAGNSASDNVYERRRA